MRFRASLGFGILAVVLGVLPGRASEAVHLLTVGNSFADDATACLPALAKAGDKPLVLFRANLGGCSLERHARHLAAAQADPSATDTEARPYKNTGDLGLDDLRTVSLIDALKARPWDFVTVQQVSHLSFKPESYEPHASRLIAAIREHAPQAEILVHQTWAYREDHPIFQKGDGFTPVKMYERSRAAYHEFAARYRLRILPSGDALQLARATPRWTFSPDPAFDYASPPVDALPDQSTSLNVGWHWAGPDGERKFTLDAIHSNPAGRYLEACVWYQVIFDTTELPADYRPEGVSAEDAAALREHARAAVAGGGVLAK